MAPVPPPRQSVGDASLTRPDWTKRARDTEGVIALDKNENTDPVFRRQLAEILSTLPAETVIEYPECAPHYHLLAEHLDVTPQNLLFAPGSDGAIRAVFQAFVSPGDVILMTAPTFAMFPIYSRIYAGRTIEMTYEPSENGPLLSALSVLQALSDHRPRLLCLPNPDSPTGTIFAAGELEEIIRKASEIGTVTLIDEAYFPFSDVTALSLIDTYENLVVTRTFAKAWGVAGLRLGFAAAHADMAEILHKVRPMYEVNGFALAAMVELIKRQDLVTASVRRINAGKQYFLDRMQRQNMRTLNAPGNFMHVDFGEKREAVYSALRGKVLYKKSFPELCLAGFSRFTAAPEDVIADVADIIDGALG